MGNRSGLTLLNLPDPPCALVPKIPPATVGQVRSDVLAILKRNRNPHAAALELCQWLNKKVPPKASARWFRDDLEVSDPTEFESHERVRRCVEMHGYCICYAPSDSLFLGRVCRMTGRDEALGWWKVTEPSTLQDWRSIRATVGGGGFPEPDWPEGVKFWRVVPVSEPDAQARSVEESFLELDTADILEKLGGLTEKLARRREQRLANRKRRPEETTEALRMMPEEDLGDGIEHGMLFPK